jgi:ABC-type microcin C transport system duplicated ATPase subunit YejF
VVLDEPTSALDMSVQKQIVELLRELQHRHGLVLSLHQPRPSVVRAMADYIIVMKQGKIVEEGLTDGPTRSARPIRKPSRQRTRRPAPPIARRTNNRWRASRRASATKTRKGNGTTR